MSLTQPIFDKIHLYLSNQMNYQERLDFEKELHENATLQEELTLQKRIKDGLKVQQYKQELRRIAIDLNELEEETEGSTKRYFIGNYLPIAASVLLIIGVFLFLQSQNKRTINERLENTVVSQDIKKSPLKGNVSPVETNVKVAKKQASKSPNLSVYLTIPRDLASPFREKDSFGITPTLMSAWESDSTQLLYGADILIRQRKYDKAFVVFTNLEKSQFTSIKEYAMWYTAITYLLQRKDNEGVMLLRKIASIPTNRFNSQALSLLNQY